ncbi:hypothetical protein ACXVUM_16015 [Williamsia sp. SKLECPSW1]
MKQFISEAWAAVRDAGVPEPLQELAFTEALSHLKSQALDRESKSPEGKGKPAPAAKVGETPRPPKEDSPRKPLGDDERWSKFASESGIPEEDLRDVFYFDAEGPRLNGPRSKYGLTDREQARAIALAITSARNYALDEIETPSDTVKAECTRLKLDLGGNWSTAMNALTTISYSGPGRAKTMHVKSTTHDDLKRFVASVRGVEPTE